jgi:AraC-like DNA-binding protein
MLGRICEEIIEYKSCIQARYIESDRKEGGFQFPEHFMSAVKKVTGTTPLEYLGQGS